MVHQLRACTTFAEELFSFQKPHLVDHNHPHACITFLSTWFLNGSKENNVLFFSDFTKHFTRIFWESWRTSKAVPGWGYDFQLSEDWTLGATVASRTDGAYGLTYHVWQGLETHIDTFLTAIISLKLALLEMMKKRQHTDHSESYYSSTIPLLSWIDRNWKRHSETFCLSSSPTFGWLLLTTVFWGLLFLSVISYLRTLL